MSNGTAKASMPPPGQVNTVLAQVGSRVPRRRSSVPAWHHVAEVMIRLLALTAIAAIVLIFAFVAKEALPLLFSDNIHHEVTLRQMWTAQTWPGYDSAEHIWQPVSNIPKYGIWPLILGTLKVSIVSMLVATPLGVASALYLSQYASRRVREVVKPAIELLAGIPSVVLGFFALMVMASWFQDAFDLDSRLNAIVAGVALSIAIIPLIFTISEEAIGAVPRSYVEASTALGAARWQTIVRVLLPAASPGIAAAVALGLGRAVGETMVVLMASGNAAITSASFSESVRTLSASVAAELAEVVFGGPHYTVLFFLGTFLFVITFGINLMGDFAIRRMKRKLGVGL
ncbi:MAG TPA: phosphate ABC transporter permease subunit PstC [Polyangia bacterium]|jgi:phosphate transport system permease protein|nr:phosphate ABC transporter permease subunit PstC [Polyangia bacterium]